MQNQLKTLFLLGVLSSILVAAGAALGPQYMGGFFVMALLMNLGAYFFSDKIVLAMSRAREVSPAEEPMLHRIVDDLVQRAGMPKPRVFVTPEQQPNAFATGRNPNNGVVAVTQGIMRMLSERELRGVIAHELAHIKNRDILIASIAAAIATAISYLANAVQWAAIFGGGRRDDEEGGSLAGSLAFAFIAPLAATLVQLGISRSREYLADEAGAKMSGDPEALASALEKLHYGAARYPADVAPATASLYIVSPLSGGQAMLKMFSTHPPMEERIARLRALRNVRAA